MKYDDCFEMVLAFRIVFHPLLYIIPCLVFFGPPSANLTSSGSKPPIFRNQNEII